MLQDGCTALIISALQGYVGVGRILIAAGAGIDLQDDVGFALY